MASDSPSELESFHRFLSDQIETGNKHLTPEESVHLWRSESVSQADLEAIREGLADVEAGRVRPIDDVAADIRKRYGFPDPR